jgi:hypothetical protein
MDPCLEDETQGSGTDWDYSTRGQVRNAQKNLRSQLWIPKIILGNNMKI